MLVRHPEKENKKYLVREFAWQPEECAGRVALTADTREIRSLAALRTGGCFTHWRSKSG